MELVKCIKDDGYDEVQAQWIRNFPVKGEVYTVRKRMHTAWGMGLLLEEIQNPLMPNGAEPNFNRNRFKPVSSNEADGVIESLNKTVEVSNGELA